MKLGLKLTKKDKQNKKIARRRVKPKAGVSSLESVFLTLFISLTLLLFVGALLVYQQLQSSVSENIKGNQRSLINSYARQIESSIENYIHIIDLSTKQPGLIKSLRDNDTTTLKQRETMLAYMFPSALRVNILSASFDELDNSVNPPISYSCLDLIQRSHTGKGSTVELHLFGKPHQHIDIVRSIKDSQGEVIGSLLVTLPVQSIKQTIYKMNASGGLLQLIQDNNKGKNVAMAHRGDLTLKDQVTPVSTRIKHSPWKLMYWPNNNSARLSTANTTLYWGISAAIWISFSLILFLLYRRLYKALLNDQIMMIKIVKDVQHGEIGQNYPIALKNCIGTMEQLRMIAGDMTGLRKKNKKKNTEVEDYDSSASETSSQSNFDPLDMDLRASADALEVEMINDNNDDSGQVPGSIFKAYDIRGIYPKTLNADIAQAIGRALGSEAQERGQHKIVVARDGRLSGPDLNQSLIRGLQQTGREVIDIGRVPTPVLYFASHYMGNGSGIMLTGSHNPPDYNGMKIMLQGESLHGDAIKGLKSRIDSDRLVSGEGSVQTVDVVPSYIERITSDVRLERPLKIIVDCGNGVAGEIAPQLYKALGCEVIELFCDVDGNFPNHHPDPSKPENLTSLIRAVTEQGADLGLAFDGDGDRLGVIDSSGKIIWPDRYLMILAADVLSRQPGAQIIYDVKCTRDLEDVIAGHGGQPLMWKTGHSFIKAKMLETGAQLAGEMSGHIFFKERWMGFDDALYAGARLLEVLSSDKQSSSDVFAALPENVCTPELNVSLKEGENFTFMDKLKSNAHFPGAKMIDIDGVRLEFEDGWGLIRASNTTPSLVLRFEAADAAALGRIQDIIRTQMLSINADLDLPF